MNDGRPNLAKLVKEANDIVAVIGHYLNLRPAGEKFKGLCPFHNDSHPSLIVDPKWQNYKCWSCGKSGDVFTFIQEYDKVNFVEAMQQLARRANINLDQHKKPADAGKLRLLDGLRWAAELYQAHLLDDPAAEAARTYLGDRKLLGETVRKFGLGFAPPAGDWLARKAEQAPVPVEALVEAGLLAPSSYGTGYYDRFRDRVMFPIRDLSGRVTGFGGRILPQAALAERGPKYYNSSDSLIFRKGELVFGLDSARLAAQATGFLAVVEGYTDVLMAHQAGVTNVVATMGTALTADHVRQMRRFAPRVVLVYDADAGGATGVDRALELFIREDVDLAVATLPDGLDPYDLIVQQGAAPFKEALTKAVDVLEYKLQQLLTSDSTGGIEAGRRAVEAVIGVLALAPESATTATKIRRELIISRVAHRFGLKEQTLWARLDDLRRARPVSTTKIPESGNDEVALTGTKAADPLERQLVQVLLAEPVLVAKAKAEVPAEEIQHEGLQRIVTEMYNLLGHGVLPDLDALRMRLIDKPKLADFALRAMEVGKNHQDRVAWLNQVLRAFRDRRTARTSGDLKSQLKSAGNPDAAIEILRKLQQTAVASG